MIAIKVWKILLLSSLNLFWVSCENNVSVGTTKLKSQYLRLLKITREDIFIASEDVSCIPDLNEDSSGGAIAVGVFLIRDEIDQWKADDVSEIIDRIEFESETPFYGGKLNYFVLLEPPGRKENGGNCFLFGLPESSQDRFYFSPATLIGLDVLVKSSDMKSSKDQTILNLLKSSKAEDK